MKEALKSRLVNAPKARLLVIDPQNDFCDVEGAALPVPGADMDMRRLAGFIANAGEVLADIVVTLDSHATVGVERVTFWKDATGQSVLPFTEITEASVRAGQYAPVDLALTAEVLAYLEALESSGRHKLRVWPVHCVLGTWGHNIHAAVAAQLANWESTNQRSVLKVLKGLHPLTEQYSAIRAEVPRNDDVATQTNKPLVDRLLSGPNLLVVAGEASSHCVAATMTDLFEHMTPEQLVRTVLLRDCMGPVAGCISAQHAFFAMAVKKGVRVATSGELLQSFKYPLVLGEKQ